MISKNKKNDKYNSVLLVTNVVGKNIRFARECRSLGVKKMAEIAGVSESTIRRIENGDPSVASGLIARVLNLYF